MNKLTPLLGVAAITAIIGFGMGWVIASAKSKTRLERVVAMSWGDGKYGAAFYGAHVYLEPQASGYSVQARVYLGRDNDSFHNCGELGKVATDSDAVARWGKIDWRADGLYIGTGTNHYFLAREQLENHR